MDWEGMADAGFKRNEAMKLVLSLDRCTRAYAMRTFLGARLARAPTSSDDPEEARRRKAASASRGISVLTRARETLGDGQLPRSSRM